MSKVPVERKPCIATPRLPPQSENNDGPSLNGMEQSISLCDPVKVGGNVRTISRKEFDAKEPVVPKALVNCGF